jgi:hypothetical protein
MAINLDLSHLSCRYAFDLKKKKKDKEKAKAD